MKAGTFLLIASDVILLLVDLGIIEPDGTFNTDLFQSVQTDVNFAVKVETILRARGVDIPEKVDKVIGLIPIIVSLLG